MIVSFNFIVPCLNCEFREFCDIWSETILGSMTIAIYLKLFWCSFSDLYICYVKYWRLFRSSNSFLFFPSLNHVCIWICNSYPSIELKFRKYPLDHITFATTRNKNSEKNSFSYLKLRNLSSHSIRVNTKQSQFIKWNEICLHISVIFSTVVAVVKGCDCTFCNDESTYSTFIQSFWWIFEFWEERKFWKINANAKKPQ